MKNIVLAFIGILLLASIAMAVESIQKKELFSGYSSANSTTVYSTATNTGTFTKKSIIINGNYKSGTYGNYSGTVVLQGAPTASGPWVTLKDKSGNATSATTNTVFHLEDLVQYVRASWTKTKHQISVWMYYAK